MHPRSDLNYIETHRKLPVQVHAQVCIRSWASLKAHEPMAHTCLPLQRQQTSFDGCFLFRLSYHACA